KRMGYQKDIVFACDNGERDNLFFDHELEFSKIKNLNNLKEKHDYVEKLYESLTRKKNYVQESYLANYPECTREEYYQDIRLLDGNDFKHKVDLFVGGSPCQSFSSVGFQEGLEDTRGTLFYEFARLVKEIEPKVFIYENVRNLFNHDNGNTWNIIKGVFESLGYHYKYAILNAADYGIPQTRRRVFVVGFKDNINFDFPPIVSNLKYSMKDFLINNCDEGYFNHNNEGDLIVDKCVGIPDNKYILSP